MSTKNGINKTCPACGALFYVQAYRSDEAKFCSMKCLWAGRPTQKKPAIVRICLQCAKEFTVRRYRADVAKFCSPRCGAIASGGKLKEARAARRKPGVKVCSKCKEEKPHASFWKYDTSADGLRGVCIRCRQAVHDQWIAANPGKKEEADRRYYAEHADELNKASRDKYAADPEAFAKRNREWRDANPEKVTASNRRKREKHGDDMRARRRQHYQDNKARYKAQAVARQKHIKQATPSWADMEKIAAFYVESERLTKETGLPHHVDHIYPLRGKTMCGLHVEGNLQILLGIVNLRKSNRVKSDSEGCKVTPRERRRVSSEPKGELQLTVPSATIFLAGENSV